MNPLKVAYISTKTRKQPSEEIKAWADLIEAKWRARDKKKAKAWIKTISLPAESLASPK